MTKYGTNFTNGLLSAVVCVRLMTSEHKIIGRSVRSTTASVIQIPNTPPPTPIIPKKNHETSKVGTVQPRQSVRYKSPTGPVSSS